jgi:cobaltochelatase CobN
LPGKACGVSKTCWPDIVLEDLPNLYPYIINNPGEGTQAKRRSACCILDHLIPPQTSAGKSEDLRDVERLLEAVYQATHENPAKLPLLAEELWTAVEAANLQDDLGRSRQEALADLQAFARDLHGYLNRIGTISISDGLHILGQVPEGTRLNETLAQFTRLPVDPVGSLWDRVAAAMGFDGEDLRDNPGELLPALRRTKGQVLADVVVRVRSLFDAADEAGWETTALPRVVESVLGQSDTSVERVLRFVAETLRPNLLRTTEEIDNALAALSGRYVPAGGAGCPTRGMLDILPTGRNFYSVDPFKIPTPEAWKTGVKLGDALMAQYHEDTGAYPEQLAMVVWASPTMRTRGDDIAEIFYLMGLRPHWHHGNGRVLGLEVVPLEELAYPRVDITLRTSGLFRDAFPNLLDLLDEGVRMVAALQEPADRNILARNVAVRVRELELAGVTPEEARRRATFRVFSDRPGTYGAGVDILLESGTWKTPEELGDAYVRWGGYAYGDGAYGQTAPEELKQRLAAVDLTLKNEDSREEDILSSDDYNAYFGGLNAAVRYAGGRYARSYTGDTSDPRKPRHRATEAEGKFIFRARILNPKWIDGLKRHGYKGAGDLSRTVDICFQWDATSDILRDWQYKRLAETYAFDPDMQEFFRQHNPDALHNIAERLLEAIRRGMWEKPGDSEGRLEALYLETEGDIEDRLG